MPKRSAGILVYRRNGTAVEVLLAHPGGPYWAKKDAGAWSIPKGEVEDEEALLEAAKREFSEELGQASPEGTYIELGSFKRRDGKQIFAWAIEGNLDTSLVHSNTLEIEWPPRSGEQLEIPEIDRASWFPLLKAPEKMHKGQESFIYTLAEKLHIVVLDPPEQQTLL